MFEALGERLAAALKKISGRGVLRPQDVEAWLARRDGHRPLGAGPDFRRPAAVEQLKTLAEREGVACVLPTHGELVLPIHGEVARSAGGAAGGPAGGAAGRAIDEAARLGCDVVILDTAGRLHVDAELMDELRQLKSRVRVTE